ncbi:uncharacterized protein BO80DRAFT_257072 [Aspergillus ibericus CBS 121593]|uniref:Serine hydrolase domain-containing protein n=1 Tax=Aspergillus ibericus CBS 121593 TaxID=1448316 RepID=A0A395HD42_9EURO|nr:hypothetical protein BO80DRAFT_257072 [Aspergillus ibericus CBS 121593]RAL04154.1 hypothetical protein BO80DRAFT_257072 [Aspergillus ibericus CBS 121593]
MDIFYHKTHFLQDALNMVRSQGQPLPKFNVYYSEAPYDADIPGMESKVWGHGLFDTQPVSGLERSVGRVLRQLEQLNPVVGIIGFSTGATLAMIIASLLEKTDRCRLFGVHTTHPPLKFVIAYSGFMLGHPMYRELYYPAIRTPGLIYVGELDTMITPTASYRLARTLQSGGDHDLLGNPLRSPARKNHPGSDRLCVSVCKQRNPDRECRPGTG